MYRFQTGDQVKARGTIFNIAAGTRGIVIHCYASLWGLYEVQFDTQPMRRVVWAEDLEAIGLAGVHDRPATIQAADSDGEAWDG